MVASGAFLQHPFPDPLVDPAGQGFQKAIMPPCGDSSLCWYPKGVFVHAGTTQRSRRNPGTVSPPPIHRLAEQACGGAPGPVSPATRLCIHPTIALLLFSEVLPCDVHLVV